MSWQAKVIEDSICDNGVRLTTLQLRYWRGIHAEFMTHRVFSRNASSSRAIPVSKVIEQVRKAPAMPLHWGKNQPGMQAHAELTGGERFNVQAQWLLAANQAADVAQMMDDQGAHKQVVNRILEPFQWMAVIVTATDWANFFELRDHADAQPEIRHLAQLMKDAMGQSIPFQRYRNRQDANNWHLPYVTESERLQWRSDPQFLAQLSAARCARVSYLTHDGQEPSVEKDLELYRRLVGSRPLHASPIEHQAYPLPLADQRSRNFAGWRQHREIVEHSFH